MHQFLQAFAAVTAQVVREKTIYEDAGIDGQTLVAYEQLLANLFAVDRPPAWWTNRLK